MSASLYEVVSSQCSRILTRSYSTSFSLGIRFLVRSFHEPIHSVYGFVRVADEIVDSFIDKDRRDLLDRFEEDTYRAIREGVSTNPILESFQRTVHAYGIEEWIIESFLRSMRMDLVQVDHDRESFNNYVFGSAEAVGLMCLRVFTENDDARYRELEPYARALGSAFQKVNFLRDLCEDRVELGRSYFPHLEGESLKKDRKEAIEEEIASELKKAYRGIIHLPKGARLGVYIAYVYYRELFRKIQMSSPERIEKGRIRIPNLRKFGLLFSSYLKYRTLST